MSKFPEIPNDLLDVMKSIEDLSNFKAEWGKVIDHTLELYDATAIERTKVIDVLYKNHRDFNEDIVSIDVIEALRDVRLVEGLNSFKNDWITVIEPVLKQYAVSAEEEGLVIDELHKIFVDNDEDEVKPEDVVDAICFVRADTNNLH